MHVCNYMALYEGLKMSSFQKGYSEGTPSEDGLNADAHAVLLHALNHPKYALHTVLPYIVLPTYQHIFMLPIVLQIERQPDYIVRSKSGRSSGTIT
jgi:hypothetical protein